MEVESDILEEVIGCKEYHERVPEFGERAYKSKGKDVDIIYRDTGNTWCDILAVISKKGIWQKEISKFYKKLDRKIAKSYDEDGYRIN